MPPFSRLSPLVEILRSDQRRRWLDCTPCRVEEYLSTHPELATDREALLDLLYAEVCLRQEMGESPEVDEYVRRFPQFQADLLRLFEVDEAVRRSPDSPSSLDQYETIDQTQPTLPAAPIPTQRIGDYDILGEIARGGMGVVFKARQRSLNRPVALKVIRDSEWANPDQIVRFRNEAETVAKLDHPGIVAIYEVGQERGQHYFAMAYIEGKTLHERIREEPLPPTEAARLMQSVAEAVQFAHAKRILHRDLKPQNILLDHQGCPKVVDFGLAKRLDLADGQTATGAVLGTPSYMAPEQALGKSTESDATVDVYGLGAVLYATLTGRPPFQAAALADTLRQVIESEPVPPRQLNPAIPRDLETVCLKCLEKSPARRYASAAEMAADLGRFLRKEPIVARPVGRSERTWRWCLRNPLPAALSLAAVLLVMTVAIVSTAAYFREAHLKTVADLRTEDARRSEADANEQKRQAEKQKIIADDKAQQALQAEREARQSLYFSNIGLANHYIQDGDFDLANQYLDQCPDEYRHWEWNFLSQRAQFRPRTILGGVAISCFAFSADGQQIAAGTNQGELILWDDVSQKIVFRKRVHDKGISGLAFNRDGSRLVTTSADGTAKLWSMPTGEPGVELLGHESPLQGIVAFSPDGNALATASVDQSIRIWDPRSGKLLHALTVEQDIAGFAWGADNRSLYTLAWQGPLTRLDTWGEQKPEVINRSPINHELRCSADGRYLAMCGWTGLYVWDLREPKPLLIFRKDNVDFTHLDQSADGHAVALTSWNDEAIVFDVLSGRRLLRVPHYSGGRIALSPDGAKACIGKNHGLDVFPARLPTNSYTLTPGTAGAASAENRFGTLISAGDAVYDTASGEKILGVGGSISPDRKFLFRGNKKDGTIEIRDLATGELCRQVKLENSPPKLPLFAVSPDGACVALAGSGGSIRVLAADGGKEIRTIEPVEGTRNRLNYLKFAPHGEALAAAYNDGTARVWQARTGQLLACLKHHVAISDSGVQAMAFNSDGNLLATGGGRSDRTIALWRWRQQELLHVMSGHWAQVVSLDFSPDDRRLLSGGYDGTFRLWDPAAGQEILTVEAPYNWVDAAFSPDGGAVLTNGSQVWGNITVPLPAAKAIDLLPWLRCYEVTSKAVNESTKAIKIISSDRYCFPIPVTSTGSYVLRCKFTRNRSGKLKTVGLLLPAGVGRTLLVLDHTDARISGLDGIDGHWALDHANPTNCPIKLVDGKPYTVRAEVTLQADQATMTVQLDGREVIRWQGPQRALSVWPGWDAAGGAGMMGLFLGNEDAIVKQLDFKPLDDRAQVLEPPLGQALPPPPGATVVTAPGNIDLLPLLDLEHGAFDATAKRTPQGIVLSPADEKKSARLAVPVWPHGVYELRCDFTPDSQGTYLGIVTPVDRVRAAVEPLRASKFVGLCNIRGFDANAPENPTRTAPGRVTAGKRYKLLIRVAPAGPNSAIDVLLDDQPYFSWKGSEDDLSLWSGWDTPHQKIFALCCLSGSMTYHTLRLKMLSGEAWILDPRSKAANPAAQPGPE